MREARCAGPLGSLTSGAVMRPKRSLRRTSRLTFIPISRQVLNISEGSGKVTDGAASVIPRVEAVAWEVGDKNPQGPENLPSGAYFLGKGCFLDCLKGSAQKASHAVLSETTLLDSRHRAVDIFTVRGWPGVGPPDPRENTPARQCRKRTTSGASLVGRRLIGAPNDPG